MNLDYKIINLEQGSIEWKQLRRNLVTSTDVSCFFGQHLTFRSQYSLWENKKSGEEIFVSDAMRRGSREESRAMNFLRQKTGIVFSPCVVKSSYLPIMSSLDGMDFDGEYLAEIKVPAAGQDSDMWEKALRGIVPKVYQYQIQTSLMITRAKKCYFFVFDGAFDGVVVEVLPNYEMWEEIEAKSVEFREKHLVGNVAPDDKVDEVIRTDEEFVSIAKRYASLDAEIKALQAQQAICKSELLSMTVEDVTTSGGGVKIAYSISRSSDDIKQLIKDNLPSIDLDDLPEKYKGKPKGKSPRITIEKKAKKTKPKAA